MRKFIERNSMTIACTFMAIMLASVLILSSVGAPVSGDTVDCYDRFSNKIEGEVCTVENGFDNNMINIIMMSVLGILFIIGGYIIGSAMDSISRPFAYCAEDEE